MYKIIKRHLSPGSAVASELDSQGRSKTGSRSKSSWMHFVLIFAADCGLIFFHFLGNCRLASSLIFFLTVRYRLLVRSPLWLSSFSVTFSSICSNLNYRRFVFFIAPDQTIFITVPKWTISEMRSSHSAPGGALANLHPAPELASQYLLCPSFPNRHMSLSSCLSQDWNKPIIFARPIGRRHIVICTRFFLATKILW